MPVAMQGGKMYSTVQERLKAAHGEGGAPTGITMIHTETISLPSPHGPAVVIKATVTFGDRVFTGIAEVPFDAQRGAEKTNPWEVAETSAVGRALAFAGYYGSDDGLAGAEEIREAQRRAPLPPRSQAPVNSGAPRLTPPTEEAFEGLDVIPPAIVADTQRMRTAPVKETAPPQASPVGRPGFITTPQVRLISVLLKKLREPMPADINELSIAAASQLITDLKARAGEE